MSRIFKYGITLFICDSCGMKAKIQDDEIERLKIHGHDTPLTLLIERYGWSMLTHIGPNGRVSTNYYCPECTNRLNTL